jgi:hypothetical protein
MHSPVSRCIGTGTRPCKENEQGDGGAHVDLDQS